MPLKLPLSIVEKCLALINLGNLLQLYDINIFVRVMDVSNKLQRNELYVHDLQSLQFLCNVVKVRDEINETLREDIEALHDILDLFIAASSAPAIACGGWAFTPETFY